MTWTGPGFVDRHNHELLHAGSRFNLPADVAAHHRSVLAARSTPADEKWVIPIGAEAHKEQMRKVLRDFPRRGLVAITEKGMDNWEMLDSLRQLRAEGEVKTAVELFALAGIADAVGPKGLRLRVTHDPMLDVVGVKFYADGWLGCRTCAVSEPFADSPGDLGVLFIDSTTLAIRAAPYAEAGFRLATHAIGDRAVETALRAYQLIYEDPKTCRQQRPSIEHGQVLRADLVEQLVEWGVVVCMQPSFGVDDAAEASAALSPERHKHAYQWSQLLERGVLLESGTDAPIGDARPLAGLQQLVTGAALGSRNQVAPTMKVEEALSVMTDEAMGTVTLSEDPRVADPFGLSSIHVLDTVVFKADA
jgi:predicted amidohydrolase YtcJ